MQMGRWFGYRFGLKISHVFSQTSFNHYSSIHIATEELRDELEEMSRHGLTPLDFGLKVRNSETGIMITTKKQASECGDNHIFKKFLGVTFTSLYIGS